MNASAPAIEPRHGFRAPRYYVYRLTEWAKIPPVPLLTDLFGEEIAGPGVQIQLAHTAGQLRLRATIKAKHPVIRRDLPAWQSDHIEVRLGDRQHIFIADGRCVGATVPVEVKVGDVLRGLVAYTRWGAGFADIIANTPAVLGFSQQDRFAEFVIADEPPEVWARLRLPKKLPRPGYTHIAVPGVGAVTLRAPVPPLRLPALRHPYLYFDQRGLAEFRRKAKLPVLKPLAESLRPVAADFDESHLQFSFDFDRDALGWFRVAKESMVNPRTAAHRHIWNLMPAAAQAAWRDVIRTVTVTDAQLAILLPALNGLLRRRDLYQAAAFADVHLPPEGHALVARCAAADLPKRNRILIQSAIECCHKFKVDLAARIGGYLEKWLLSGDRRLITLATRTARAAADAMIPEATFHLHEGNASLGIALAYDTFYPYLTPAERGHWRRLLVKLLDLYLYSARTQAWTVTAIPNANPVGNAGGGILALALWREEPVKARAALQYARKYLWKWLDWCGGSDGGNTEGAQYWAYGTESFLRFALLLEKLTGTDEGLVTHPLIRNALNMVRVGLCNDGALHGVNDTIPMPVGSEVAWALAGRFNDRFALWYGDHALRWYNAGEFKAYRVAPLWGILFRPAKPEVKKQPEPLPRSFALRSIEYGILRSSTNWNCRWTVGLKGSRPPYTHHNQADTGSFFLDYRGQRLLIDPGYYKPAPTDHSLPIINGVAPETPSAYTGKIIACREGYLAVDSTAAYRGAARRVIRHLVMVGEDGVVLLDDIAADGKVLTQFQAGAPPLPGRRGFKIADIRLAVLTRPDLKLTIHPERSLHDTHWGYHFSKCRLFPVTGSYPVDEHQPLLVTFTASTAVPPTCRRSAGRLCVTFSSGRQVVFFYSNKQWNQENKK